MTNIEIKMWLENFYPTTIVADRYSGAYSGGLWTCWPLLFFEVPEEIDEDDATCMNFWEDYDKSMVGIGNTIMNAYKDLYDKMLRMSKGMEEKYEKD